MGNATSTSEKKHQRAKPRILCLHGWRTSGDVLKGQMKAFSKDVEAEYVFMNAPFSATGPADELVALFYPEMSYYQWYLEENEEDNIKLSLEAILAFISTNGPFDGFLGFSQGAEMCTYLAKHFEDTKQPKQCKGVILIGGVSPSKSYPIPLTTPSLHIMGTGDPYLDRSNILLKYYENTTKLVHDEMHNIPSIRTNTYVAINAWLLKTFP